MAGPSEKEERRIIVRMIKADRQAINRMTEHKRAEFENVLRKGMVSMLNAEDERVEALLRLGPGFFHMRSIISLDLTWRCCKLYL